MTIDPAARAGRITSRACCARAAEKRSACASGESATSRVWRRTSRIRSASGVPPGSRVSRTSRPRARSVSASRAAWADLPTPSPPSNETKRPLISFGRAGTGPPGSLVDLDAAVGLVTGRSRAQVRALDELVLQLADVRVLWRQLDLVGLAAGHLLDRVARLLERLVLGPAPQLEHRGERARDLRGRVGARDVDRDALRLGVAQTRRLAPVIVLECDHDVGLLGLAHDRDGQAEPARGLLDTAPRESKGVDLHHLAPAVPGDARRAAPLDRLGGGPAGRRGEDRDLARSPALADLGRDRHAEQDRVPSLRDVVVERAALV